VRTRGTRSKGAELDVRLLVTHEQSRAGFVVPRHGHTAVERNTLKRRLRDIVRTNGVLRSAGGDFVIYAHPGAYDLRFDALRRAVTARLADVRARTTP
jgi:ribonuclease P protein component